MGTRSTITIHNWWDGEPMVTIYNQYDGYPTGIGATLKDFLEDMSLVNGMHSGLVKPYANGMGCLAAQLIKELKTGAGGCYIANPGSREGHHYEIRGSEGGPVMLKFIYGYHGYADGEYGNAVYYDGPIADFDPEKVEEAISNEETV